jgi:hypothetical protein
MAPVFGEASTNAMPTCSYCGGWHTGMCPRIKSIDYYPDGSIKHVELVHPHPVGSGTWPAHVSIEPAGGSR